MEVPNHISVDYQTGRTSAQHYGPNHGNDFDDDDDDNLTPKIHIEPAISLMSPPKTLTAIDISEEERRRYVRDTSMSGGNVNYIPEDSVYKTPDAMLRSTPSDPVGISRQVRHLHNRVKLLEDELQAQHNRQVFLIGFVSVYIVIRCIKWLYR